MDKERQEKNLKLFNKIFGKVTFHTHAEFVHNDEIEKTFVNKVDEK